MVKQHSSIKHKIAFSFFGVSALLTAMIFFVIGIVFLPSIWKVEEETIESDLHQAINMLDREFIRLGNYANDWAYWDDTYRYLADEAPNYEQSNLSDDTLRIANFSFINITTLDGEIVWGRYFKPDSVDTGYSGSPTIDGVWSERFKRELSQSPEGLDGYLSTHLGTIFIAARPVLTSHKQGPSRGWVIVGFWLNGQFTQEFSNQMRKSILFAPADLDEVEAFRKQLTTSTNFYIKRLSLTEIRAKALIRDYKGDADFTLTIDKQRIGFIESLKAMISAFLGLTIAGIFCSWFAYRRVKKVVLDPLSELAKSMEQLGNQNTPLPLPTINNGDEITLLYRKYRQMAKRLIKTQQALKEHSACLEEEALTDPLTKLHNRRYLDRLMARVSGNVLHDPSQKKLLLVIDVDHFKKLNDNYGHATGDMVLIQLANILNSIFRENDHVVRMGGEEFLVVSACQGEDYSQKLAERVRSRIEAFRFGSELNKSLPVTVSIGFAWFPLCESPMLGENWQTALELADYGLYKAKVAGRNSWCGYYADLSITETQLAMIPDKVDTLVESKVLRQVVFAAK
ncbi:diguanylate cyclase [Photobacterium sagamiensis]|uniref:diguanylate cyclase domain-containing protein n=1 Tax=Photobacterium sagamiensis TaxID=2910241 RepID=UPI003D13002A